MDIVKSKKYREPIALVAPLHGYIYRTFHRGSIRADEVRTIEKRRDPRGTRCGGHVVRGGRRSRWGDDGGDERWFGRRTEWENERVNVDTLDLGGRTGADMDLERAYGRNGEIGNTSSRRKSRRNTVTRRDREDRSRRRIIRYVITLKSGN